MWQIGLLKIHTTSSERMLVAMVTKNDKPARFTASSSFEGSITASSYLPVATMAKSELMEMNRASSPKSSGGNSLVSTGSASRGMSCASVLPETSVRVFLIYSELRIRFHIRAVLQKQR